jgi:hypothetical protein
VLAVSGIVQSDGSSSSAAGPLREFDVTMALDKNTDQLRPGTSVRVLIAGAKLDNVTYVPRHAVFEREGKPMVFLRVGQGFEPRPVTLKYRTESQVVLEGLDAGAEIAMVNPDTMISATKSGSAGGRK